MTFYLNQGGVVMSSQITHTHLSTIHHIAYILSLDNQQLRPFYSLPQPYHAKTPHPSTGDKPIQQGRAVRKNTETKENWLRETQSSTDAQRLSTFSYLSCFFDQSPPSPLCCPRPPLHHSSKITTVYTVPPRTLL